jgi:hypothetical protein
MSRDEYFSKKLLSLQNGRMGQMNVSETLAIHKDHRVVLGDMIVSIAGVRKQIDELLNTSLVLGIGNFQSHVVEGGRFSGVRLNDNQTSPINIIVGGNISITINVECAMGLFLNTKTITILGLNEEVVIQVNLSTVGSRIDIDLVVSAAILCEVVVGDAGTVLQDSIQLHQVIDSPTSISLIIASEEAALDSQLGFTRTTENQIRLGLIGIHLIEPTIQKRNRVCNDKLNVSILAKVTAIENNFFAGSIDNYRLNESYICIVSHLVLPP